MDGAGGILPHAAARFGDRPALVTSERTLSFRELDLLSDRVAVGLRQRGVEVTEPEGPGYTSEECGSRRGREVSLLSGPGGSCGGQYPFSCE
jgi:non-ribosomal peptide synthetase component F